MYTQEDVKPTWQGRPLKPKQPAGSTGSSAELKQILSGGLLFLALLGLMPPAALGSLEIESAWSSNPCPPGKPFYLTVTVSWNEDVMHYAVRPPQLDLPEGIIKQTGSVSSRSLRKRGKTILTYRWTFIAEQEGQIPPIPIKLTVFIKDGEEPSLMEIETEALVAEVPRWKGIPAKILFLSGALLLLAAIGLVFLIKKNKSPALPSLDARKAEGSASLPDLMDSLNKNRIQGDTLFFLKDAIKILNLLCPEDNSDSREVKLLLDQAQYGNLKLTGEEMEQWYLRLKRRDTRQPEQTKKAGT